jgi:3-oxoacyl-[acyl-carrier protein] reductase
MDLQLKNKRALVTGASRGLGYAAALGLAREGACLAINSRSPEAIQLAAQGLSAETGSQVAPIPGDVVSPEFAGQLVERAVEALGGLDILITNSGGPPAGKFESLDDAAWLAAVELNLMSHVRLIRAALPHLRRSSTPSVLTVTSYSVKQPIPGLILSNSIRASTIGLTKTLAQELGGEGIRFNSILPGWTETERVESLLETRARTNQTSAEEEYKKQTAEIALGRMARPEEFANVAVFLVSPAASYLTGIMLNVDGGVVKGTF